MIFTELRFAVFLALLFALYWSLQRALPRKVLLLVASYVFYGAWDWRFLGLIWLSTAVDYLAGIRIENAADAATRKRWVTFSVAANLGILGVFKYFDFFAGSLSSLAEALGWRLDAPTLGLVLPVGISFYTFQTMSYSLDVYRGRLRATRNLLDLALFVAFFPQLVAGPIVRARDFLPQLGREHRLARVNLRAAAGLFLVGFVKKAVVSDNVAPVVDTFFADPARFTAGSAWVAVLLYAAQIYCDFSGYSDMAIASARTFGYELCPNFDRPYLAADIRDFWRRWHISLSTWLRDYLYVSLGGNRGSRWQTRRNLMLTMLLGGLWHGASWNFVIWGGLHGGALTAQREWSRRRGPAPARGMTGRLLGILATFLWVCFAWIFFRAESLGDALVVARQFVLLDSPGTATVRLAPLALVAVAATVHVGLALRQRPPALERWPGWVFGFGYGAAVALVLALVPSAARPFIYFQF